jgi:amino acid transporter
MLYVFIPLALIFLGVIVFFAVSKKTEPRLRLAAIIALGAITLAVMVCLILVFVGSSSIPVESQPGDFLEDSSPREKGGGLPWVLIIFTIILLGFLGVVIYLALKEQKQQKKKK